MYYVQMSEFFLILFTFLLWILFFVFIPANGEAAVQKNGESSSLKRATEPNDFVVVELDGKAADAPVISEILEIVIHKEEVRESEGDQTDVSLPATNLQTVSTLFLV